MNAMVVWLVATVAFWFVTNLATNMIEATVHNYRARAAVMTLTGTAIGALASAVGYSFFILTILLVIQLWFVRRKMMTTSGVSSEVATKYAVPTFLLIAFATVGSYFFSMETCDFAARSCKRVFFERLYTPPHLQVPK